MLRRTLGMAGLAFALCAAGAFAGVGIQVWVVKAEVNRQTTYLTRRAHEAGDAADRAIGFVKEVIKQAQTDLDKTRDQTAAATPPARVSPILRMTARQASVNLAGSVERALGAVVAASDAVAVADAALDVLSRADDYPELEQLFGVHPDQVRDIRGKLGSVSSELRQAKSILGVPVGSEAPIPTAEQLAAVDEALRMAEQFRMEMGRIVKEARNRVDAAKNKVDQWAWRLAAGTTALCAVGLVGQFFLARFCLRKLYNLPA